MNDSIDVFVIGGGINGAAVARDAIGRGLTVKLAEKGDYAHATSSASSKLIHGGLRYLEHGEFRLVSESLKERDILMRIAPHLVFPLRFLVPITRTQIRPVFLVRFGLWLYDKLSARRSLSTCGRLTEDEIEDLKSLKKEDLRTVLHYPDCWADDARLSLETLLDARSRGADISNYREVTAIIPVEQGYRVKYCDRTGEHSTLARFVVNASGPWANRVLDKVQGAPGRRKIRLIRGSHIVLPMPEYLQHDAYTLQGEDGRIIFSLPWMDKFLIVGTTDVVHTGNPGQSKCSEEEREYLLTCINDFFSFDAKIEDIVWSYAGVRPLVDDGSDNPRKLTRDYVLQEERHADGALITIYGGKITTHRRLAEKVMHRISALGVDIGPQWTSNEGLHGGDMDRAELTALAHSISAVPPETSLRWVFTYGSETQTLLDAIDLDPRLAREVVPGIPEVELIHAVEIEDARSADDYLYRRTKMFLFLTSDDRNSLENWFLHYLESRESLNKPKHKQMAC